MELLTTSRPKPGCSQHDGQFSPYDLAILYAGLGDKERAFEQLNKAYEDRAGFIIMLRVEPLFDSLRSDPRFAELVSRMKFPPSGS